jgi:DNA-binding NarL/FixJ family response regulator
MHIEEAKDGNQAKVMVHDRCHDLIFMDINLPGQNGLELAKAIKQHHKKPIIVMATNYDLPEYREAAYRYGATHFIAKGTSTRHEIVSTVEAVLAEFGWDSKTGIGKEKAESSAAPVTS